jgi:hypothetical protein
MFIILNGVIMFIKCNFHFLKNVTQMKLHNIFAPL